MMIKNIILVFVICLTASVIVSCASELPPECTEYLILDDPSRNVNHGYEMYCDSDFEWASPDWQHGNSWHRMMSPAGVVIPETAPGMDHCGTHLPGWITGTHPTEEGQQVEVEVCFSSGDGDNDCLYNQRILVTNCGAYFVYFLAEVQYCWARYCAADSL